MKRRSEPPWSVVGEAFLRQPWLVLAFHASRSTNGVSLNTLHDQHFTDVALHEVRFADAPNLALNDTLLQR